MHSPGQRRVVPGDGSQICWERKMLYRMALPVLVLAVAGGGGRGDVTSPASRGATLSASAVPANSNESIARSGDLHFTKECSEIHRPACEVCTITSSNPKESPGWTRG